MNTSSKGVLMRQQVNMVNLTAVQTWLAAVTLFPWPARLHIWLCNVRRHQTPWGPSGPDCYCRQSAHRHQARSTRSWWGGCSHTKTLSVMLVSSACPCPPQLVHESFESLTSHSVLHSVLARAPPQPPSTREVIEGDCPHHFSELMLSDIYNIWACQWPKTTELISRRLLCQ